MSNQIIRRSENPDLFKAKYLEMSSQLTCLDAKYSFDQIQYYESRAEDEFCSFKDESFIILNKSNIICCVLITKILTDDKRIYQFYEQPCTMITNNFIDQVIKRMIMKELSNILNADLPMHYKQHLWDSKISVLGEYMLKLKGVKVNNYYTSIIDTSLSESELMGQIRKGTRHAIKWGMKNQQFKLIYKCEGTKEEFYKIKDLHLEAAGRSTRSDESWERQYQTIRNGNGFAVISIYENEIVSGGLYHIGRNHCYYGVSAAKRDLFNYPIFHGNIWKAVLFTKSMGIKFFEMGNIQVSEEQHNSSDKELNISLFKKGFGGSLYSQISVINNLISANEFN